MMGLNVYDNLTSTFTAPVNALASLVNKVRGQYVQIGNPGAAGNETFPLNCGLNDRRWKICVGESTHPCRATLSDPGIFLVEHILELVTSLSQLISGGPDGKPDWDTIHASVCVPHEIASFSQVSH